jgi:hypothetical protein
MTEIACAYGLGFRLTFVSRFLIVFALLGGRSRAAILGRMRELTTAIRSAQRTIFSRESSAANEDDPLNVAKRRDRARSPRSNLVNVHLNVVR